MKRCRSSRTRCRRAPQRGGDGVGSAQCVPQKRRSGEDAILVQALKDSSNCCVFCVPLMRRIVLMVREGWSAFPFLQGWVQTLCVGPGGVILFSSPLSRMSRRITVEAQVAARQRCAGEFRRSGTVSGRAIGERGISPTECCAGWSIQHSFCVITDAT